MQATWPARNAPNALLMQAVDAPLPDDPPLPSTDSAPPAGIPSQAVPSGMHSAFIQHTTCTRSAYSL